MELYPIHNNTWTAARLELGETSLLGVGRTDSVQVWDLQLPGAWRTDLKAVLDALQAGGDGTYVRGTYLDGLWAHDASHRDQIDIRLLGGVGSLLSLRSAELSDLVDVVDQLVTDWNTLDEDDLDIMEFRADSFRRAVLDVVGPGTGIPNGGDTGYALVKNSTADGDVVWSPVASGGSGDMAKAVYDPTNVNGDAFSMANMVETAAKKVMTAAERTEIAAGNGHRLSTSNPHNVTKAQVGLGNVDNTSDADKPISTATQTALDGKAAVPHTHTSSQISDADTEPTAHTVVKRDGFGRTKVATPSATGDATPKSYVDGLIAQQVAKSFFFNKGDILLGLSSGNPSNLSVGSNDQVLTVDSTAPFGVRWATPAVGGGSPTFPSGAKFPLLRGSGNSVLQAGWNNVMPVFIPYATTWSEVSINVTNAGSSPSEVEIGLYSAASVGGNGTLVHDFGTVDTTTTGQKVLTGSWSVPAGLYYVDFYMTGNACTCTAMGANNGLGNVVLLATESEPGRRYLSNGGSGGLPASLTTFSPNGGAGSSAVAQLIVKIA